MSQLRARERDPSLLVSPNEMTRCGKKAEEDAKHLLFKTAKSHGRNFVVQRNIPTAMRAETTQTYERKHPTEVNVEQPYLLG